MYSLRSPDMLFPEMMEKIKQKEKEKLKQQKRRREEEESEEEDEDDEEEEEEEEESEDEEPAPRKRLENRPSFIVGVSGDTCRTFYTRSLYFGKNEVCVWRLLK